jgi:hypothetical protein
VQTALACLMREGLIERKRKVGTFVTGAKTKLTCAGLYFNRDLWLDSDLAFYQMLQGELRQKFLARSVSLKVWIDDRTEKDQDKIFPAIKQALDRSDIQALVAPLVNPGDLNWIKEIPVASANPEPGLPRLDADAAFRSGEPAGAGLPFRRFNFGPSVEGKNFQCLFRTRLLLRVL